MTHEQITRKMNELGMAWAVSSKKFQDVGDDKAYYHVHPDASYPHQNSIKRFTSIDGVSKYVDARYRAANARSFTDGLKIMGEYEESLL